MTKNSISFEKATVDQAEFLTDLALKSNDHYKYRSVSEEEALKVFTVPEKRIRDDVVMVMKLEDNIIGFFSLCSYKDNELYDFFLKPKYIGKGYGRIMFQQAKEVAQKLGWKKLEWESDPFSEGFYRKMGATEIPEKIRTCPLNPKFKSPRFEIQT
jgi:GNAT superfamily N-acetyltransferase